MLSLRDFIYEQIERGSTTNIGKDGLTQREHYDKRREKRFGDDFHLVIGQYYKKNGIFNKFDFIPRGSMPMLAASVKRHIDNFRYFCRPTTSLC